MFFGSAAVWEVIPGASEIMTLLLILPIVFFIAWETLLIKLLVDKRHNKASNRISLILFRITLVLCITTIAFEVFIFLSDHWYEAQTQLAITALLSLVISAALAVVFIKHIPKHAIAIAIIMLIATMAISIPTTLSIYEKPHDYPNECDTAIEINGIYMPTCPRY